MSRTELLRMLSLYHTSDILDNQLELLFRDLGDSVVRDLEDVLSSQADKYIRDKVLYALADVASPMAMTALTKPLKAGLASDSYVQALEVTARRACGDARFWAVLTNSVAAKSRLLHCARDPIASRRIIEVARSRRWVDAVPVLTNLVAADAPFSIREQAANALEAILGTSWPLERPESTFADISAERWGAIGSPTVIDSRPIEDRSGLASYVTWFDGYSLLMLASTNAFVGVRAALGQGYELKVAGFAHQLLGTIGAKEGILCALTRPDRMGPADRCLAVNSSNAAAWEWAPSTGIIDGCTPIYRNSQVAGMTFVSWNSAVAVSPGGEEMWTVTVARRIADMHTHPYVGEGLLIFGGEVWLVDMGSGVLNELSGVGIASMRVERGRFMRDSQGAVIVVAGNETPTDAPALAGYNLAGEQLWKVTLSSTITGLEAVRPEGGDLVIVRTYSGELLAVDVTGALRGRAAIPNLTDNRFGARSSISCGSTADDKVSIVVKGDLADYLYAIQMQRD